MTHSTEELGAAWFQRDTLAVARELLGMSLIFQPESGQELIQGRIIETEAYCGPEDKASHASRGRTPRTEVMFGPAAHWYVYLIYGMYHCLNVVTGPEDYPAAVLIRGVDSVTGLDPTLRTDGPGKLCRAYGIDRTLNRSPVLGIEARLWLTSGPGLQNSEGILASPRIGIGYAEEYREKPWRFRIEGDNGDKATQHQRKSALP